MKAVELPNSVFKKEVHLPPSPPPTVQDCLNEKAVSSVGLIRKTVIQFSRVPACMSGDVHEREGNKPLSKSS